MRSPEEGPRKGLLFFRSTSAPTQERSSAVVMDPPKPYIEVEPEPQFQPQPEPPQTPKPERTKKSLIRRLAQNLAVRLGFATLALSGSGYAAYQEIPAVHRTIDNVIGKVFGDEVPNTFDNKIDNGVIGDNNIVRMTREEIQQLPSFDKDGKPILLFPFTPPEGQTITFTKRYHGGYVHPDTEVDTETTRNSMDLKIPAGTTISSSGSENVQMFFGGDYGDGTSERDSAIFVFKDKNGFIHRFIIAPNKKLGESNVLQSLVNAPAISKENSYGKEWEKGLTTSEGQKVTITLRDAEFTIAGLRGENPNSTYGHIVEDHLQFKTNFSGQLATSQG